MMERHLALRAAERLLERDLEVVTKIGAARGPRRSRGGRARPEEHVEDVAETLARSEGTEPAHAGGRSVAGVTEAVVHRALLRIGKHFVGLVDFFEANLGGNLILRDVRMKFPG